MFGLIRRVAALSVLSLALLSAPALADITLEQLVASQAARMERQPVLRADFVQTKELRGFKKPLVTRGRMVFSRSEGALWAIEQPIAVTYALGTERVAEIGADDSRQVRSAAELPGLAHIGRIFRALLAADVAALREVFEPALNGEAGHWQLTLTPKEGPATRFLQRLVLSGGEQVESIRIEEASGDTAVIRFSGQRGDETLTPAERALFGTE